MLRPISVVLLCSVLAGSLEASENPDYINLMRRARAEYRKGNLPGSEVSYLSALKILQRGEETDRAATLSELGDVYVNDDQLPKAETAYLESLAISRRLADKTQAILILRSLGALYSLEHHDDEALKVLKEALKLTKAKAPTNQALLAQVLNGIGVVYFRGGNHDKAEKFTSEALEMAEAAGVLSSVPQLLHNRAVLYCEKRDFKKAEELFKRSIELSEAEVGVAHPDLTFGLMALANMYTRAGRYTDAEAQIQRALRILEPFKSAYETRIAKLLEALSAAYAEAGRKAEADAVLSQAAILARRNLEGHAEMAAILDDYSVALRRQGKPKEAEQLQSEARRSRVATSLVVRAGGVF